jgi:glutathione peroxidase
MKNINIFLLLCGVIFLTAFCMENNSESMNGSKKSLHEYVVENINGEEFDLSQLKGKKVMVVNTASKCGLTPQYEQLEALYKKYGSDNFTIIAFPSNDFMGQ